MSTPQDPFAPPPEDAPGSGTTPPPDQPGRAAPPPGGGAPPPAYGAPPPGYGAPLPPYGAHPPGYGAPPPNYGAPPPAYGTPAGYPQPYGYGGYPAYPKRGTNVLAILSLVFAFVCSPVGIVLGAIGLNQIKRTGEEGRGIAIAGLVLSGLFTLLVIALFVGVAIDCANNPETC